MPSVASMRQKTILSIYETKMAAIKSLLRNTPVTFILDETRDDVGRNVLNILCGKLGGKELLMMLVKVGKSKIRRMP